MTDRPMKRSHDCAVCRCGPHNYDYWELRTSHIVETNRKETLLVKSSRQAKQTSSSVQIHFMQPCTGPGSGIFNLPTSSRAAIIMHVILLSTLCAAALAAPVLHSFENRAEPGSTWQPAQGTAASCDKTSDKIIGFYVGPQMESVLTDACAAMMPSCAYPARLAEDVVCAQVMDWRLDGQKNNTQSANVETLEGNKISGWDVKFSVTPVAELESSAGVFWTAQDCYGYFAYMLQQSEPAGCHTEQGFGVGSITVGGDSSLAGTVFTVEIIPEELS
ncbi:hypothetical protein OPT61_g7403 [Boeremia exigua]|uniref:Uncharacterized protein n=1 Tax=Boeremia exigua TaxID=749465 RepID=A0ACC2I430_9PLEO|nr:hypothetical protein OPT61_g7403 [Boeremia exigua]